MPMLIRREVSCLLNLGRVVLGRVFFGASCLGASCLWGELSCFHVDGLYSLLVISEIWPRPLKTSIKSLAGKDTVIKKQLIRHSILKVCL